MKILFKNARILTLKNEKIINGDLLVENNKIARIGSKINVKADKTIDCEGNLLMPGFKNAHSHSAMTFLRSATDDLPLDDWLNKTVFPREAKLRKGDVYALSKIAFLEYLTSGITSCFDMYYFPEEFKKASEEIGMRNVILYLLNEGEDSEKNAIKFYKDCNKKDSLVTTLLGFHAEYTSSLSKLKFISYLVNKYKLPIYTHANETLKEIKDCMKRYEYNPIEKMDKLGIFNYGGGIYHGVHLCEAEMNILKNKNVGVVTCPASNLKLASGIASIKDLVNKGIKVSIGTDGPASNNGLDMFREMYLVSTLSKYKENDCASIKAIDVIKMATKNGADLMRLKNSDTLEVGKYADIIMIDLAKPDMQPINNIINNIVYAGNKLDIKMTMINGKILYFNNKFYLKEDVKNIYKNAYKVISHLR